MRSTPIRYTKLSCNMLFNSIYHFIYDSPLCHLHRQSPHLLTTTVIINIKNHAHVRHNMKRYYHFLNNTMKALFVNYLILLPLHYDHGYYVLYFILEGNKTPKNLHRLTQVTHPLSDSGNPEPKNRQSEPELLRPPHCKPTMSRSSTQQIHKHF